VIIRSTPDNFGIVFILTVIMPKADFTDFILPAAVKSFEFAARASVRRRQFLGLDGVLERLSHVQPILPLPRTGSVGWRKGEIGEQHA
jgi:hypothetical protein